MSKFRITYNAPVVLTFTLLAVAVFCLNELVPETRRWFIASNELRSTSDWVGLISHILGHANWNHLLGNFMLILLLGPILEERHGSIPLLIMILVTALVTGMVNLLLSHGLLGASGIVFMMIILASTANIKEGDIPLTFIAVAVLYLGGELVASFKADDGVAHFAHLIGGASGGVLGFLGAGDRSTKQKSPEVASRPVRPSIPKGL